MKVAVLGSTGMLGNTVARELLQAGSFEIYTSYRNGNRHSCIGPNVFYFAAGESITQQLMDLPKMDYIINCIGTIKPDMGKDLSRSIYNNSIFPHDLASWCTRKKVKLIHITTDCVYSGNVSPSYSYTESDIHDAYDYYGKSKSLGECFENAMVLRTSIIGRETKEYKSLLEWFLRHDPALEIAGYTNHLWNGITTNTYAQICNKIMTEQIWKTGLYHIFSPERVSKFTLLNIINNSFELNRNIIPVEADVQINRCLDSEKDLVNKLDIPSLKDQLDYLAVH